MKTKITMTKILALLAALAGFLWLSCSHSAGPELVGEWRCPLGDVDLTMGIPDGVRRFYIVHYARPADWVSDDPGDPGFSAEGSWRAAGGVLYLEANEKLHNFKPGTYAYQILTDGGQSVKLKHLNDPSGHAMFQRVP